MIYAHKGYVIVLDAKADYQETYFMLNGVKQILEGSPSEIITDFEALIDEHLSKVKNDKTKI